MLSQNWLLQSLIALLGLIPAYLAIGFFDRNYNVKPDVFLFWYFLAVAGSSALFGNTQLSALVPSGKVVVAVVLVGLSFGAVANIFQMRAIACAPNPGLAVAISTGGASVGVFLASGILSRLFPSQFSGKMDWYSFLGVILTFAGLLLIGSRRN